MTYIIFIIFRIGGAIIRPKTEGSKPLPGGLMPRVSPMVMVREGGIAVVDS